MTDKQLAVLTLTGGAGIAIIYALWKSQQNVVATNTQTERTQGPYPYSYSAAGLPVNAGPVISPQPFQYSGPSLPASQYIFNTPGYGATDSMLGYGGSNPQGVSTSYLYLNVPNQGLNLNLPPNYVQAPSSGGCGCGGSCGGHGTSSTNSQCGGLCPGASQVFASVGNQLQNTLQQDPSYLKDAALQIKAAAVPPNFNVFTPAPVSSYVQ